MLNLKKHLTRKALLIAVIACALPLQACAPLIIGAGVGALISTDRRPAVLQASDRSLQVEISSMLKREFGQASTEVAVWNRRVLVLGSVYNESMKQAIQARITAQSGVTQVINELLVSLNPSLFIAGNDALLTTRIKTSLVAAQGVNSSSMKVVSYGSKVYLMGWVNNIERPMIITSVRHTLGVVEVVDLMEEVR